MGDRATKAPAGWLEALARGRAEAERGETVPAQAIFDELRQVMAEMEADSDVAPDVAASLR